MPSQRTCLSVVMLTSLASLIGCAVQPAPGGSGSPSTPQASDQALPDFALADVNAESARYQENVSPRDYLSQVSAWYFGHST